MRPGGGAEPRTTPVAGSAPVYAQGQRRLWLTGRLGTKTDGSGRTARILDPANYDQYRAMAENRIRFAMPPVVAVLVLAAKGACRCRSAYWYSTPRSTALNGLHMRLIVPAASDELLDEQVPDELDAPTQPPNCEV
jgi:hypothetical protein